MVELNKERCSTAVYAKNYLSGIPPIRFDTLKSASEHTQISIKAIRDSMSRKDHKQFVSKEALWVFRNTDESHSSWPIIEEHQRVKVVPGKASPVMAKEITTGKILTFKSNTALGRHFNVSRGTADNWAKDTTQQLHTVFPQTPHLRSEVLIKRELDTTPWRF